MLAMAEFKMLPRLSVKTTSGWASSVSCNTPVRAVTAEIIYTAKLGSRLVLGTATAKTKASAVKQALDSALAFYNQL